jgi:hypothetical protein
MFVFFINWNVVLCINGSISLYEQELELVSNTHFKDVCVSQRKLCAMFGIYHTEHNILCFQLVNAITFYGIY